jgi:phage-related minor tail protein
MEVEKTGMIEQALAKAVLDKSGKELRDALLAEVWAQHREELLQQALEQVRHEQQKAEESRKERWEGQKAQERRELVKEAEQLIQEGIDRGMADERQDFEERRQRLIRQRDEAKARADDAETWIVGHIKTLFPSDGGRLLLRNPEIRQFRMYSVNRILSRFGLAVRAKVTDTAQVVATEIGPQH